MSVTWVTILAFTVAIPFLAGFLRFKVLQPVDKRVWYLTVVWLLAELLNLYLMHNGHSNASVSYGLTAFEIWLFCEFYSACFGSRPLANIVKNMRWVGIILVAVDYLFIRTPLNTFSLTVEYVLLTCLSMLLFYEIALKRVSDKFLLLNLVLLFYLLSSFPYFFAWEWMRTSNLALLKLLSDIHVVIHALCYLVIAGILWKSTRSSLVCF